MKVTLADGTSFTGTTTHPVWSIDAADWKRIDELQVGERLQTLDGEIEISSIEPAGINSDVFNIEVDGEHVYRLLNNGILVHNADYVPDAAVVKALSKLTDIPWGQYMPYGCKEVAEKIHKEIGGTMHYIEPKHGLPSLGERQLIGTGWADHWVVELNGRVYDAMTGVEGLPVEIFTSTKIWTHADDIKFPF